MFEGLTEFQILLLLAGTVAIAFCVGRMTAAGPLEAHARYREMARRAAADDFARLPREKQTEIDRLIAAGKIFDAIKLIRASLGLGLYEAKQIVDQRRSQGRTA